MNKNAHSIAGITLLELMVTIAIAAILVTIAIPSFIQMVRSDRSRTTTTDLQNSLLLARSEAVKRDKRVTLCASSDQSSCDGKWAEGWIAFEDADANGQPDEAAQILLAHEASPSGVKIVGNTNVADSVSYLPSGRARSTNNGPQNGTIKITVDGEYEKRIVISTSGRARIVEL